MPLLLYFNAAPANGLFRGHAQLVSASLPRCWKTQEEPDYSVD